MKSAFARPESAPPTPVEPVSRAVLRRVEPGNMATCALCKKLVKFEAKKHPMQVICNIYENGKWNRVEHYHKACYIDAGEPYGKADASKVRSLPSPTPLIVHRNRRKPKA